MIDDFQYNGECESEMGQIHGAIHVHLNAIAAIRRNMPTGQSRSNCVDCNEIIPLVRRKAAQGCQRCIHCQALFEHQK